MVLEIKDLDILTTKEDILKALQREFQNSDTFTREKTVVGSMRRTYSDTNNAVIQIPVKKAQQVMA